MRRWVSSDVSGGALLLAIVVRCAAACSSGASVAADGGARDSGVSADDGASAEASASDSSAGDSSIAEVGARDGGSTDADGSEIQEASADGDASSGPDGSKRWDGGVCAAPGFPGNPWAVASPLEYATGVATADFDGDGLVDLLSTGVGGGEVLLGHGDGTFAAPSAQVDPGGFWYYAVALDVDGDGHPDALAVDVDGDESTVVFARGLGDGTFAAPTRSAAKPGSTSLGVGDFDGDGKVDAIVGGPQGCALGFMKGNGDGTFQAPAPVDPSCGGYSSDEVGIGDVNGDGHLDVAAAGNRGLRVFLGNGDGTFGLSTTTSTSYVGVTVGDLNGDGKADLVLPRGGYALDPKALHVRLSRGDGTFDAPAPVKVSTYSADLADVDGDGRLDLIAAGTEVCFGRGDGTFEDPVAVGPLQTLQSLLVYGVNAAVADLNGDGVPDLALATERNFVDVVPGLGGRTFAVPPEAATGESTPHAAATADFNGDGNPDIVVIGADISVLMGDGTGALGAPHTTTFYSSPAFAVAAGDVDGDGIPDLLVGAESASLVYHGVGNGKFTPGATFAVQGYSVALADLDGDGKLDAIMVERNDSPHTTGEARVARGRGNGTFAAPVAYAIPNRGQGAVVVADFSGDGKLDLAIAGPANIHLLLGRGDGTFAGPVDTKLTAEGGLVNGLAAGDFDGDGRPELAVALATGMVVLSGKKDGSFAVGAVAKGVSALGRIAVGDFNQDGTLDVVAAARTMSLHVFLGDGHGDLQFLGIFPSTSGGVSCVVTADFDGDGRTDVGAVGSSEAAVLLDRCR